MSELGFEISRLAMDVAIRKIEGVISSYETLPVLKTYHIKAEGKKLTIAATDMELGVTVEAEIDNPISDGDIAIPADKFSSIVKFTQADSMFKVVVSDGLVSIRSVTTKWQIRGISGSEFPRLPKFEDEGQVWILKRLELVAILERLHPFVASESELSVGLKAISVQPKRIMATNGRAMSLQRHNFESGSVSQIPGHCVRDLISVLRLSGVEDVSLIQGSEFLFINVGGDVFFTRLFDNWSFPDVSALLQSVKDGESLGTVNSKEFVAAITRVKVTSDADKKEIRFHFQGKKGGLFLSTGEDEGDASSEVLKYKAIHDNDFGCIVSWEPMVKALLLMQGPDVKLQLCTEALAIQDMGIHLTSLIMRCDH